MMTSSEEKSGSESGPMVRSRTGAWVRQEVDGVPGLTGLLVRLELEELVSVEGEAKPRILTPLTVMGAIPLCTPPYTTPAIAGGYAASSSPLITSLCSGHPPEAAANEWTLRACASLGMDCCQSLRLVTAQVRLTSGGSIRLSSTVAISVMVPERRSDTRRGRLMRFSWKGDGRLFCNGTVFWGGEPGGEVLGENNGESDCGKGIELGVSGNAFSSVKYSRWENLESVLRNCCNVGRSQGVRS